jgi:hypothetical protein
MTSTSLLQDHDPLRDPQARRELIRIEGLAQKIVGAGGHPLQKALLSRHAGEQDQVGVFGAVDGADPSAQLEAVQVRHLPV